MNGPLRFPDEYVRHKVLDLIGDLALAGRRIEGHVVAERAGHAMHTALVSRLLKDRAAWELAFVTTAEQTEDAAGFFPARPSAQLRHHGERLNQRSTAALARACQGGNRERAIKLVIPARSTLEIECAEIRESFMSRGRPVTLRTLILLLAIADLVILGMRLRPWTEIVNLPEEGTTGFDPIICLLAYLVSAELGFEATRTSLSRRRFRLVLFSDCLREFCWWPISCSTARDSKLIFYIQIGLLIAAGVLWGMAGLRGAEAAGNTEYRASSPEPGARWSAR